jgi:signal transduction histidine kinase/DNA-binding response OmpR family regulator
MNKYAAFILLFIGCIFNLHAQLSPSQVATFDSLIERKHNEKAYEFIKTLDAVQKKGSIEKVHSKILLASILGEQKHYEQAEFILDSLFKTPSLHKHKELLALSYLRKGIVAHLQNKDSDAIENYLKVDSIADAINTIPKLQVRALVNLGNRIFSTQYQGNNSKFSKSEDFYLKALTIAETINDSSEWYQVKIKLAFIEAGNPQQKAIGIPPIFNDAIRYFETHQDLDNLFAVYNRLPKLYMLNGDLAKAELLYKDYIQLTQDHNLINNEAKAKWLYGHFLKTSGRTAESISMLESAKELFKQDTSGDLTPYTSTLGMLANQYKEIGRLNEAYETLELYHNVKDSIDRDAELVKVKALDAKYQSEKKEQEIALLKAENAVKETQKYIYIGLVGLLLVGCIAIYWMYRNKLKTAEKIKELNTLKSRFFANISHEFRTPLTLIKSPVQSLRTQVETSQQPQLDMIEVNSNRMLELVDQLLELSKIDSGHLKLILKQGHLSSFLNSIVEPFAYQSKTLQKPLQVDIEETASNILFDKDVIEKIVSNLLSNALKYGEDGITVHFTSNLIDANLQMTVSNTTNLLTSKDLPKLFERFYQSKTSNDGAGIGLALVKELVQLYEGTIDVQLNNQQLTFTVKLPLHSNLKHAIVTSSHGKSESQTSETDETANDLPIVLVVDDHPEIRQVIAAIFENDYQVLQAKNGKDALQMAQKEIPDIVISDIMMPEMDGFEFCKQIKNNELTSFIPIILLTAKTSDTTHVEALQSTADAFLTKPFNHDVLKATVIQQLQERKKLQSHYSQELILKPTEVLINSVDEKFINRLQEVFQQEFANPDFNTELFASKMTMSRMQLHRKLKSLFGISATEFVRNERLKTAADLMKNKQLSISEIAYGVGFNDLYYFSKCFKDLYKIAPSEYQKSL